MAVGFNFNPLSKYIHGCGLILLHRKERGPCKQAGKREEPGRMDQEWVWWWEAQARAHGYCASSRGPGKCQSGKSHGEFGLCTWPLGTQGRCSVRKPGPRLSGQVCLSGTETCACVEHLPDIPPLLQFSCALVAGQEGVNCSFTWRLVLVLSWVRVLNVIFGFVTCLSETLNTLRFLCWDLCLTCFTATITFTSF